MAQASIEQNWASSELVDILQNHALPTLFDSPLDSAVCRCVCRGWRSAFPLGRIQVTPEVILSHPKDLEAVVKTAYHLNLFRGEGPSSLEWLAGLAHLKPNVVQLLVELYDLPTDNAAALLKLLEVKFDRLRSLSFYVGFPPYNSQVFELVAKAIVTTPNHLEALDFSSCHVQDGGVAALLAALPRNKTIRSLNVSNCSLTKISSTVVLDFIKQNRIITNLNVSGNNYIDFDSSKLGDALAADTTLRTLGLGECPVTPIFFEAFRTNQTLRSLEVDVRKTSGDPVPAVLAALEQNLGLHRLKIQFHSPWGSDAPRAFGNFLKTNTTLQKLKIHRGSSTDADFGPVVDGFVENTSLTSLDARLFGPDFIRCVAHAIELGGASSLKRISLQFYSKSAHNSRLLRALSLLPRLESVNLRTFDVAADAIVDLAALIKNSTSLSKLHICRNGVGGEGLDVEGLIQIANASATSRSLRYLAMRGNANEDAAVCTAFINLIASNQSLEILDLRESTIPVEFQPRFEEALTTSRRMRQCRLNFDSPIYRTDLCEDLQKRSCQRSQSIVNIE
jgi:Leucine-rich repeat (LRR) protein